MENFTSLVQKSFKNAIQDNFMSSSIEKFNTAEEINALHCGIPFCKGGILSHHPGLPICRECQKDISINLWRNNDSLCNECKEKLKNSERI